MSILVKDIMNEPVRPLMPETSLAEAMSLMRIYDADGLPVTIDKEFIGYVWLKDILALFFSGQELAGEVEAMDMYLLHSQYAPIMRADVKRVITVTGKAVSPSTPVHEAMSMMLKDRVCSLAVTEHSKLVGLLDYDDANKAVMGLASTKVAA